MLLYAGPDQIIPLTSFLGTAAGLAMIFWGKILNWAHKVGTSLRRKTASPDTPAAQEPISEPKLDA